MTALASQLLPLIAAVSLGLLAGALLAEDRLLVPYWRTVSAETFYALHPTYGPLLYQRLEIPTRTGFPRDVFHDSLLSG